MRILRAAAPLTASLALLAVPATAAAPRKITAAGAGKVKIGATYRSLRNAGLVGRTSPGCELNDPKLRVAKLRAPLKGSVELTRQRRVKGIFVTGGATARGVGIGDRMRAVKRAYPQISIDHGAERTFGVTLAMVPRSNGGVIQFAVRTSTRRVQAIAIPIVTFCE